MNSSRFLASSLWLDLIYPPQCALCNRLGEESLCKQCADRLEPCAPLSLRPESLDSLDVVSSACYYRGIGGVCVRKLKFERATSLAQPMAQLMFRCIEGSPFAHPDAIVAVPLHWLRLSNRGFNQSQLLSDFLDLAPPHADLLKRTRYTRPQSKVGPIKRQTNVSRAFVCKQLVANTHILLVDDVFGSGQTLNECARALKLCGAKRVDALTFARA